MITLIETRNYRCLRSVSRPLGPFQLLVGPNAAGKSTLLDAVRFLSRLTTDGLQAAIEERTSNIYDLFWQRVGDGFELAVEAAIPQQKKEFLRSEYDMFRYEIAIELAPDTSESAIGAERGILKRIACSNSRDAGDQGRSALDSKTLITAFPEDSQSEDENWQDERFVIFKQTFPARTATSGVLKTDDLYFREENREYSLPLRFGFGSRKSALANLPEDEEVFPVAAWFKHLLTSELTTYQLDGKVLRDASPPGQPKRLQPDAANLPWVVADFRASEPAAYQDWIAHLQTALPDLKVVDTVLRDEDRHQYLMLEYTDGLRVPSWSVSEGTLRLIALTLPAYLKEWRGMLLIEEPENGLHPLAIETAYQSLSSVYDAQVLMATHSPLLVGLAKPSEVLCFTKDEAGATQIVSGDRHPRLADWQGEVDLGTLFASGVLG